MMVHWVSNFVQVVRQARGGAATERFDSHIEWLASDDLAHSAKSTSNEVLGAVGEAEACEER